MKSKPKSFPASSTFNEFLTQLKKEDQESITAENSSPAVNSSIPDAAEKVDEPSSSSTQRPSAVLGTSSNIGNTSQEIKVETEAQDPLETQDYLSTSLPAQALNKAESDNPVHMDQQELIRSASPTLAELTKLLINLPTARTTRKGYIREELQVRLSADISLALRNLSAYLSLTHSGSEFHIDDLVNHLMRQFIQTYLESIQQMGKQLAKAEASRQQQISELLRSFDTKTP